MTVKLRSTDIVRTTLRSVINFPGPLSDLEQPLSLGTEIICNSSNPGIIFHMRTSHPGYWMNFRGNTNSIRGVDKQIAYTRNRHRYITKISHDEDTHMTAHRDSTLFYGVHFIRHHEGIHPTPNPGPR